jgi:hypothetical protein
VPGNDDSAASAPVRKRTAQRQEACRDHREALIDQSLMESFPASDPPSIARPACLDEEDAGR